MALLFPKIVIYVSLSQCQKRVLNKCQKIFLNWSERRCLKSNTSTSNKCDKVKWPENLISPRSAVNSMNETDILVLYWKRKLQAKNKKQKKPQLIPSLSQKSLNLSEKDFQGGQHPGMKRGVRDATHVVSTWQQSRSGTTKKQPCFPEDKAETRLCIWLLCSVFISFWIFSLQWSLKVLNSSLHQVKGEKSHAHVLERTLKGKLNALCPL